MDMREFNPYAAGAKVYRGGSSAAHMGGGLDPIGYMEREMNKPQAFSGGVDITKGGARAAAKAKLRKKNKGKKKKP
ncbi:MAG TPA: hypothetical protein VFK94_00215, partial [Patescibacteria group bacterium]|nr:hypothetical protein [Patescibacteria group bacterium]